jgi:hypothetical protein
VCAPENSNLTQLVLIFVLYAQQNPKELNERAEMLPCGRCRKPFRASDDDDRLDQTERPPRRNRPHRLREVRTSGQYPKRKLVARYGPDIPLPDLRVEIAQCEKQGQMHDTCGVHYLGLCS